MSLKLQGIIPAVLTPFNADGSVNEDDLRGHIDFLIQKGIYAIFPLGTAGEGMVMSLEERKRVAQICVEQAAGRVPVMIHTGTANTAEAIELTKHAAEIGADAASVVAPYFYTHDEECLFKHFSAVARSVPGFPVFLYNNPGNAKNAISPKLLRRLTEECENIVGLKDTSKSIDQLQQYLAAVGDEITILTGSNTLVFASLTVGAAGVISSVANCFPEIMVQLYESFIEGDLAEARRRQELVRRIYYALKIGPYLAAYKVALRLRGREFSRCMKSPLRQMTPDQEGKLKAALSEIGVLE